MVQPGLKDICPMPVIVTNLSLNFEGDLESVHLTFNVVSFETE